MQATQCATVTHTQASHVRCSARSAKTHSCSCTAEAMQRQHLEKYKSSSEHLSCASTSEATSRQHLKQSPCMTPLNQTSASEALRRRRSKCGFRTDSQDSLQQVITGREDPLRKVIPRLSPQRPARTRYRPSTGSTRQTELIPSSHDESSSLSVPHVACHLRPFREYKPLTVGLPNHPTSSMVCCVAPWRLQFEDSKASQRLSNCSLHANSTASIGSLDARHASIEVQPPRKHREKKHAAATCCGDTLLHCPCSSAMHTFP